MALTTPITEEMKEGLASVRVKQEANAPYLDEKGGALMESALRKECKTTPRGMITKWFKQRPRVIQPINIPSI